MKASSAAPHLSFRQHPNPTSATSSPCCQTDDLKAPAPRDRGEIHGNVPVEGGNAPRAFERFAPIDRNKREDNERRGKTKGECGGCCTGRAAKGVASSLRNHQGTPETTADYITLLLSYLSSKSSKHITYHTNHYPDTPAVCSAVLEGLITAALL